MTMPSDTGRLPTLELLERELVQRTRTAPRPAPRRRLLLILALLLMGAVLAATPFGRALAERVADLVGIGDPPTRELVDPSGEPAVVIGTGAVPSGERFEIVASTSPAGLLGSGTCISLDFPASTGTVAAGCLTDDLLADVRANGIAASAPALAQSAVPGHLLIAGIARGGTESVVVAAPGTDSEYPAVLARLGPRLAERIGADETSAFFVAFVPEGGARLVASAIGAGGESIASQEVVLVRRAPPPRP